MSQRLHQIKETIRVKMNQRELLFGAILSGLIMIGILIPFAKTTIEDLKNKKAEIIQITDSVVLQDGQNNDTIFDKAKIYKDWESGNFQSYYIPLIEKSKAATQSNYDNYHTNISITLSSMVFADMSINVSADVDGDVSYGTIAIAINDLLMIDGKSYEAEYEFYRQLKGDVVTTWVLYNDVWLATTNEPALSDKVMFDLEAILDSVADLGFGDLPRYNEKEKLIQIVPSTYHHDITDIGRAFTQMSNYATSAILLNQNTYELSRFIRTGAVVNTNQLMRLMGNTNDSLLRYLTNNTEMTISVNCEFENYGNIDVHIPDVVLSNTRCVDDYSGITKDVIGLYEISRKDAVTGGGEQ